MKNSGKSLMVNCCRRMFPVLPEVTLASCYDFAPLPWIAACCCIMVFIWNMLKLYWKSSLSRWTSKGLRRLISLSSLMIFVALLLRVFSDELISLPGMWRLSGSKSVAIFTKVAIYGTSGSKLEDKYMIFFSKNLLLQFSSEFSSELIPTRIRAS